AEAKRREASLAELERFYGETRAAGAKDASEQLEELRRHYRKALDSLRDELAPAPEAPAVPEGPIVHPVRRRWPWALLSLVVLAAGLFAVRQRGTAPGRDFKVPFDHPTALVWQGDVLWAADWKEQAVFRLAYKDGVLRATNRYALPETHVTGLAVNGADFYVADSWRRQIQRWRLDGDHLLFAAAWPSPGPQPSALFFDGTSLWSADSQEMRIYRHALDDQLSVLSSYAVRFPVVGLWADAQRFWSADTAYRLIHRHRYDDVLSLVASYGLRELDDGRAPLSAFAMRGGQVWLGRDGEGTLLERPLSLFSPRVLPPALPAPAPSPEPVPAAP
ncbi:MAG: hypothetical protein KGL53_17095, partial [Elusimicrobia bacterium]|nr:hypothetical protein [Elusimicrobiota bacterium]